MKIKFNWKLLGLGFLFLFHALQAFENVSLVTGGAGFIGSHVVDELIKSNHKVVVIDDLSGGFLENVHQNAIFVHGSILDPDLLSEVFEKYKPTYVYHLAAYAAEGLSHFIKRFNYNNNLIGSVNLINESIKHKVKCFVFTSSIAVYGKGQVPLIESTIPQPEDPYGIAKLAVERELQVTHDFFGLNYVILRPHNVYGERQNLGDRYRNVIGIFMNQLMDGKSLSIFGDGMQTRAFTYISDIAPQIAHCVTNSKAINQIINVGSDSHTTVKELASAVSLAMGKNQPILYMPPRNEVMHAYSNHEKAKAIFKYEHQTTLQEGLNKMAIWALKQGSRKPQYFKAIEIEEGLPDSWKKG